MFQYRLLHDKPIYWFCCKVHQDIGVILAGDSGVIDLARLTQMERDSIKDARQTFGEALEAHGLMPAFFDKSPEVIDAVIAAACEGFRIGMEKRSKIGGEIPFDVAVQV